MPGSTVSDEEEIAISKADAAEAEATPTADDEDDDELVDDDDEEGDEGRRVLLWVVVHHGRASS